MIVVPRLVGALGAWLALLCGLLGLGILAQDQPPLFGALAPQALMLAVLVLLFTAGGRAATARRFFFTRPRGGDLALAMLMAACAAPFAAWLGQLVLALLPGADAHLRELARALAPGTLGVPPLLLVVVVAVLPAFFEEGFFRGFLLGSLREAGLPPVAAVCLAALLFAAMHLDPYRALPVFAVGLGAGLVVLVTGSIWTGVAYHFANNALPALALALAPDLVLEAGTRETTQALGAAPAITQGLVACLFGTLAALVFLRFLRRYPGRLSGHKPDAGPPDPCA